MIYFISSNKYVKIGYSESPYNRLKTLQVGSPHKLIMMKVIEGGFKKEKEIHNHLSKYKKRNEWFMLNDFVNNFINSIEELNSNDIILKSPKIIESANFDGCYSNYFKINENFINEVRCMIERNEIKY